MDNGTSENWKVWISRIASLLIVSTMAAGLGLAFTVTSRLSMAEANLVALQNRLEDLRIHEDSNDQRFLNGFERMDQRFQSLSDRISHLEPSER